MQRNKEYTLEELIDIMQAQPVTNRVALALRMLIEQITVLREELEELRDK